MTILSSFTHPHVVPNLYKFLSYVDHKRRYFEEFGGENSCWSPLTSIVGKEILWKSMGTINCLITSIFQSGDQERNIHRSNSPEYVCGFWCKRPTRDGLFPLDEALFYRLWWGCFLYIHSFSYPKMLDDWLDWSVDYCDVFISCLDSHSDGPHSLQRIHCWTSVEMLNFSKSVPMKKQTNLHL